MKLPNQCACTNVRRVSRSLTHLYDTMLAPSGLKMTQFSLLRAIWQHTPVNISQLAEEVHLDRTTLGRNLQVLKRHNLVALVPGFDLRERAVTLTQEGREALDAATPLWEKAQESAIEVLGQQQLDMLTGLLFEIELLTY